MTNWYISDPHFGHDRIIELCNRPFDTIRQMDDTIIENIAAVVQPGDDLWIVGDFGFGRTAGQDGYLEGLFERLPGRKHLVVGNHDGERVLALPWQSCNDMVEISDRTQKLVLCHYPMITWKHARRGALHLFGHVHKRWQGSRNSINVGVDVWDFHPVRLADIEARAATLPVNKHWVDVEH